MAEASVAPMEGAAATEAVFSDTHQAAENHEASPGEIVDLEHQADHLDTDLNAALKVANDRLQSVDPNSDEYAAILASKADLAAMQGNLRGMRSSGPAALRQGMPSLRTSLSATSAAVFLGAQAASAEESAEEGIALVNAAAPVTASGVQHYAHDWSQSVFDRLKAEGKDSTSHTAFGLGATENINNSYEAFLSKEIEKAKANGDQARVDELTKEAKEFGAYKDKLATQQTIEAQTEWSKANPELAAKMQNIDAPASIDGHIAGLDSRDAAAVKTLMMGRIAERADKIASGEKAEALNPEEQQWWNSLSEEEKQDIRSAYTGQNEARRKIQERDASTAADNVAKRANKLGLHFEQSAAPDAPQQEQQVAIQQTMVQEQQSVAANPLMQMFAALVTGHAFTTQVSGAMHYEPSHSDGFPPQQGSNTEYVQQKGAQASVVV